MSVEDQQKDQSRYVVGAVDAALSVLNIVADQPGIELAEVAKKADMNKSRTMRFLVTLEMHGLVSKSTKGGFALGMKAVTLGNLAKEQFRLPDLIQPILDQLRDDTGETVQYRVVDGLRTVCILGAESHNGVRVHMETGKPRELHIGSSKSILAFGEAELLERFLASSPTAYNDRTAVDRKALESQLAEARCRGFSISRGERITGAFALGAPVFNKDGSVTSCVSLLGPEFRMASQLDVFSALMLAAAEEVSKVVKEYGSI